MRSLTVRYTEGADPPADHPPKKTNELQTGTLNKKKVQTGVVLNNNNLKTDPADVLMNASKSKNVNFSSLAKASLIWEEANEQEKEHMFDQPPPLPPSPTGSDGMILFDSQTEDHNNIPYGSYGAAPLCQQHNPFEYVPYTEDAAAVIQPKNIKDTAIVEIPNFFDSQYDESTFGTHKAYRRRTENKEVMDAEDDLSDLSYN